MQPLKIIENLNFTGRSYELSKIGELSESKEAAILIVYGRRRVGKTELLEQGFRERGVLKFEGLEGRSTKEQLASFFQQLKTYISSEELPDSGFSNWREALETLASLISEGKWTIYLEEFQWMAANDSLLISELKYIWDNRLRNNKDLLLLLCGSSPSFMIEQVLHSKALHNRSHHEIHLQPFNVKETSDYMGEKWSKYEVMDTYLAVGGIPLYLSYLRDNSSAYLSLSKNSFTKDSFFSNEWERILVSSLGINSKHGRIIEELSLHKQLYRSELTQKLSINPGGTFGKTLKDLEICGFIESIRPFNAKENSRLIKYSVSDSYLRFYFKFIKPILRNIQNGDYNERPTEALSQQLYRQWLGYEYERLCRQYHKSIAKVLGFSSVRYKHGSFYKRKSEESRGLQIDLIYEREDKVYTVCEVKYGNISNAKQVSNALVEKTKLLPNYKNRRCHLVLITGEKQVAEGISPGLFDSVISMDEIFFSSQ